MKLQLVDNDGKTILFEADLGPREGEWDIFSESESDDLIGAIRQQTEYPEENTKE